MPLTPEKRAYHRAWYAANRERIRERLNELGRKYYTERKARDPDACQRRWAAWAESNPEHAAKAEKQRRKRPDMARKLSAKAALRNKGVALAEDAIEVQALRVEIEREARKLRGNVPPSRLKARQRYHQDPEFRAAKLAYGKAWRARKKEENQ